MGCANSAESAPPAGSQKDPAPSPEKAAMEAAKVNAKAVSPPALTSKDAMDSNPTPASFAVMRNGHEAMRGAMKDLAELASKGDVAGFAKEWEEWVPATLIHANIEDDCFFPLLDARFDSVVTNASLQQLHKDEEALGVAIQQAVEAGDAAKLTAAHAPWAEFYERHMKKEEAVMMPNIGRLAANSEDRNGIFHKELLTPSDKKDGSFEFFVGWNIKKLFKHRPLKTVRVWAWGLQAASSVEQWGRYRPQVKANVSQEAWSVMCDEFQLDGKGKVFAA